MKTKHIFALYGTGNVGKSTTIRKVFALLKEAYPTAHIQIINPLGIEITVTIQVEITVTIEIDGTSVGIESQGDPNSRLPESLELFKKNNCSIIVCATRTRGQTVNAVKKLQEELGAKLVWHQKTSQPQENLREQHDSAVAKIIFKQIQNALTTP